MAECVSCRKEIPAGKFFCEDCYVKMKGRRGPSGELPRPSREAPHKPAASGDTPPPDATPPEVAVAEGLGPLKKASGTLTPAASKKVISMKPGTEKAAREKTGKKRYTVTISFSERTYAALARVRRREKEVAPALDGEAEASQAYKPRSKRAIRGGGAHGRPKLKAVSSSSTLADNKGGFRRAIAYRDRAMDGKDLIAVAMAVFAVLAIVILCFMPWARISWGGEDGTSLQAIEVTGVDLGTLTYVCMAIAIIAPLYAVATWIFKEKFMAVDFGVVFISAGLLYLLLLCVFFIFSNTRFLVAAVQKAGMSTEYLPPQFELQRLFAAYAMVIAGAILAFAGLIRVSERRGVKSGETSG